MFRCIFAQPVRYCFPLNTGKGLSCFFTQNHQGVDHHGTDPALKIHANSPLSFQLFLASFPKRSTQTGNTPPTTLPATGSCPCQSSSRSSSRSWQAARVRGWTSNPEISSVPPDAVDCGRMPRRFTEAGSQKLAGKSLGRSFETSWRRP